MSARKSKEIRAQEILEAARKCFAGKGYHATSMDDIAEKSGMTKGGIYWHFASKWNIYKAILEEHKRQHAEIWDKIEIVDWGEKALTEGGIMFLREHISNQWLAGTTKEIEAEALRNSEIRREFLSILEFEREKTEERLTQAHKTGLIRKADFKSLAAALVCVVDGLSSHYHLSGGKLDVERAWHALSEALLKGLLADPKS